MRRNSTRRGKWTILAVLIVVAVLAFAGYDKAGAQEVNTTSSVIILFTVPDGASCNGLAAEIAGSESFCGELVRANPALQPTDGTVVTAGQELVLPAHWAKNLLALENMGIEYRFAPAEEVPIAVVYVVNPGLEDHWVIIITVLAVATGVGFLLFLIFGTPLGSLISRRREASMGLQTDPTQPR
jgi:hypothetical protein